MKNLNKAVGLSLIIGAFLQITRIIPITLSKGVILLENLPPENLTDAILVTTSSGWLSSHLMALSATPLLLVGFYGIFKIIKENNTKFKFEYIGISILTFGLILYTIGVLIDGVTFPYFSTSYAELSSDAKSHMDSVLLFAQKLAVSFGGTSFAYFLIGTGFFGIGLISIKRFRIYGIAGIIFGIVAVLGYSFGFLSLLLKNFQLTGGLTLLLFIYYLIFGIKIFKLES